MPAGEKEANELGLYDMSGNVLDWTNTTSGSNRIASGGSWNHSANSCEVGISETETSTPANSHNAIGFRITRSP